MSHHGAAGPCRGVRPVRTSLVAFNSCRNRHCPKCQATAAAQWMESQAAHFLPTSYFHVVFTLPATLAALALQNPRVVYGFLFEAAHRPCSSRRRSKHLGAEIGFLAVLHTWGQNLQHHPHLHCVVPAGGLSPYGTRWISCREDFFLPVRILSRVFPGKFLALLGQAFDQGRLSFARQLARWRTPTSFSSGSPPVRTDGWCTPSPPSAARNRCSSIWPATRIGGDLQPTLDRPARRPRSPSAGRTTRTGVSSRR